MNEISEWLMDEDQSPEMDFIRSLVWEELENALAELPDEQRTVFELTELEGFSFNEISEANGCSGEYAFCPGKDTPSYISANGLTTCISN